MPNILPGISVLVPTFCRTKFLSELVKCYIDQDWPGESELIIYNDFEYQNISINCKLPINKNIIIVNKKKREETLGHKRTVLAKMAKFDLLSYWDDDDIYLSHKLSLGFLLLNDWKDDKKIYLRQVAQESKEWRLENYRLSCVSVPRPLGTLIFNKSIGDSVGWFKNYERFQDIDFVNEIRRRKLMENMPIIDVIPPTIWRIHNQGISKSKMVENAMPHSSEHNEEAKKHVYRVVNERITSGIEPHGNVVIEPKLNDDYELMTKIAWSKRIR